MSAHGELHEIRATVNLQPGYVGRECPYCGETPPVCYGAEMFVGCTGPSRRERIINGDQDEDAEAGNQPSPAF